MKQETEFKSISFTVMGEPVPQPRQRHRVVKPKGRKPFVQNYTPKGDPVNDYKDSIIEAARQVYQGEPIRLPFSLSVKLIFSRHKTKMWKRKPMPRYFHMETPDTDNVIKAIKDALTGVVWVDDSYVGHDNIVKLRASGDEEARTEITIRELRSV